ncbi:hypothetical protein CL97_gp142 [Cronobacter phage CR9]|uniref:Uncharacterized protein n=1 Tax=Cronobacter phage CR9 TaxID=1162290 RepID=M1F2B9_9CAUD|nr:hypothetical protein CL97_gp142 [Cronobacter phage CR9]AFH21026.1 hypothetical protein CR9_142 [Cronobacter phage CR9]
MANLKITRTISTGVMFFIPHNEDQYDEIENKIIEEFAEQDFAQVVALNVDGAEFCQYWLSADVTEEVEFNKACVWLLNRMEELDATLDFVS